MSTGARVLKTLSKQGKTMSDLANYLGTAPSTINGWKQKNRNPSSEIIIPICEFLNVSVMYILTGEPQYEDIPFEKTANVHKTKVNSSNVISDKINKLSERSQSTVDDLVEFLIYKEETQNKKQDNQDNIISISKAAEEPTPYNEETKEQTAEEAQVYIPMLGFIAAGQPIDLPDDYTFDDVVAMPCTKEAEQADFALQIKGDSMSPLIEDGETILVKRQSTARDGQIVVASINNATTLKKFYQFPDHVELRAINKNYEPIIIDNAYTDFRILGVKL